jgi:HPr Serine kinase C-terminal domain
MTKFPDASPLDAQLGFGPALTPLLAQHLPGWRIEYDRSASDAITAEPVWVDPLGNLLIYRTNDGVNLQILELPQMVRASMNLLKKHIKLQALTIDLPSQTVRHFLYDQVAPRLIASPERLILHAALLAKANHGILILGSSGAGKSTLAASMMQSGWELLSDDAAVLTRVSESWRARAVYPSLRLLPDSVAAMFGDRALTHAMAHYSPKRRVQIDAPDCSSDGTVPIDAIFCLAPEGKHDGVNVLRLRPSQACISLIGHSFCLDPTDRAAAAERLELAANLSTHVPFHDFAYPRKYHILPKVHEAIWQTLAS